MKNFILFIWSLLFDRWEITIIEEGSETWTMFHPFLMGYDKNYTRRYVKYKYKHKFFNKEKIVKKYFNE